MKKYTHTFPDGTELKAYSLQEDLDPEEITKINLGAKPLGLSSLEEIARGCNIISSVSDLSQIKFNIVDEPYEIPEVLKPFTNQIITDLVNKNPSAFNGPVISYKRDDGGITLRRAGYFDFFKTNKSFDKIPADYASNPHNLPEGETLAELVKKGRFKRSDMADYLGIAFFIVADGDLGFVQRGAKTTIVRGPAVSGATPRFEDYKTVVDIFLRSLEIEGVNFSGGIRERPYEESYSKYGPKSECPIGFFAPGFDFSTYIKHVCNTELKDEFKLKNKKYNRFILVEDNLYTPDSVPFISVVAETGKSWERIAEECYGDEKIIGEHPIIFSVKADKKSFSSLINNMKIHDISAYFGMDIVKNNCYM